MKIYLWLVVIDSEMEKDITTLLINNKYKVSALSGNSVCGSKNQQDNLGHSLAYELDDAEKDWASSKKILGDLIQKNIIYIFYLITESVNSSWNYSSQKIDRPFIDKLFKKFPKLSSLF